MEKLFILTVLLTPVLTIPGFLCSVILLVIAKQWKWLALTLGNLLFFLFPELLLALLIIPAMIESFSAWVWAGFLFLPCIQPAWMLVKGRETGNGAALFRRDRGDCGKSGLSFLCGNVRLCHCARRVNYEKEMNYRNCILEGFSKKSGSLYTIKEKPRKEAWKKGISFCFFKDTGYISTISS